MGETSRLIFRKLTVDDAEAAAELDLKSFGEKDAWGRENFFYAAKNNRFEFFVVEDAGKIIACAGAEVHNDTAEIESLCVDPDYRRRGIATFLFVNLLEAVKRRGANFIVLEVRISNTAAIELYKNFGFQIVECEENFYGDEDAWIMVREF